jgi:uncharacterized protein DUF3830
MSQLIVRAGQFIFSARFEEQLAPRTCAAFRKAMPFESQAIHARWSDDLAAFGKTVLWKGAQKIRFEEV